jgi:hypothetical protein
LRRDFQNHGRRIRVGLDVKPRKGERARPNEKEQAQQDQRPAGQGECEKPLGQKLLPNPSLAPPPDETKSLGRRSVLLNGRQIPRWLEV